jgi:hypothetical protein
VGADSGFTRWEAGGRSFVHAAAVPAGGTRFLSLRPEKIALHQDEPTEEANRLPCRIVATAYLGVTLHVVLITEALGEISATCLAWTGKANAMAPGATVWASWPASATVLLDDVDP